MNRRYFLAALALAGLLTPMLATLPAQSQADAQAPVQTGKKQTVAVPRQQQHQDEGERIFKQNCSRCHTTPEGFSPGVSGTIVRHMRVRASLSQHDEQELLRFFNP
jgi:mono/diheme cytochrome c family protein